MVKYERLVYCKDFTLSLSLIHDKLPLVVCNDLHGYQLLGFVVSALEDSTEGALTHQLQDLKAVGDVVFDNLHLTPPIIT